MRNCIWTVVGGVLLVGIVCAAPYAMALPKQAWLEVADQGGGAFAAAVGGSPVYLAQDRRILVITEDDNEDLALVHSSEMLGGAVTALARVGEFLVAGWRSAEGEGHLSWFSLSDPGQPEWIGDFVYDENGLPTDLAVKGETLYVIDEVHDVIPISVGDPLAPEVFPSTELAGVPTTDKLSAIHDDAFLLVSGQPALGDGQLVKVFSLDSPLAPEPVGSYQTDSTGSRTGFVAGPDYMVLMNPRRPEIVSLADPAEPALLGRMSSEIAIRSAFPYQNHLIFVQDGRITAWDLSDPANPREADSAAAPVISARHIVEGPESDEALIVDPIGRVLRVNLVDASRPIPVSTLELPFGSEIHNVATVPSGLAVVDATYSLGRILIYTDRLELTDLLDPDWIPVEVLRMVSRDDGITLISDVDGVQVIDLGDPRPAGMSEFIDLMGVAAIEMHEDRAWVVGDGVLHELDLSTPLQPAVIHAIEVDELSPLWHISDMTFANGYLYVSILSPDGGVLIYRVDDGSEPVRVGLYDGCRARTVGIRDTLAAVVCDLGDSGVHFLDVSDPASPEFLSRYLGPGSFRIESIHLEADHAWVGAGIAPGVDLIDLQDLRVPFQVARFHLTGRSHAIISADDGVWVAAGTGGVVRLEAPDPIAPGQTAAWYDPERAGEGWVVEVLDDGRVLGYWYTYDEEGNPRWLIGTGARRGNRVVLEMQEAVGGRFGAGFDPEEVVFSDAGTVRMMFSGCDVGWFQYEFEDDSLAIGLERLTRTLGLSECEFDQATMSQAPANQSGSWYDPTQAGQGFTVHRLGDDRALVYWFTFDGEGSPYWLLGVGEDVGGRIVFDELIATRGARFGEAFDPDDIELIDWGELEMKLDCLTGTAEYRSDIPEFGSESFDLERLTIPAGLSCG